MYCIQTNRTSNGLIEKKLFKIFHYLSNNGTNLTAFFLQFNIMPVTKIILNDIVDKRRCKTCGKSNSTYTCDGCQSIFCQNHLLQHRQDLAYQLEDVMHNHELLREDIEGSSNE